MRSTLNHQRGPLGRTGEDPITDRLRRVTESLSTPYREPPYVPRRDTGPAVLADSDGNLIATLPQHEAAGEFLVGRGDQATIRINDRFVHRRHACLRWDPVAQTHVIEHLGGANGTYVDDRRVIAAQRLRNGAEIAVGQTRLIYRHSGEVTRALPSVATMMCTTHN